MPSNGSPRGSGSGAVEGAQVGLRRGGVGSVRIDLAHAALGVDQQPQRRLEIDAVVEQVAAENGVGRDQVGRCACRRSSVSTGTGSCGNASPACTTSSIGPRRRFSGRGTGSQSQVVVQPGPVVDGERRALRAARLAARKALGADFRRCPR